MVNNRGPLPLGEFHSTDETKCGETPGDFEPICDPFTIASEITLINQIVFLTVNHLGPLPLRELHSTDETLGWRDPG